MTRTLGIHHVTAIASEPQRNLDFYAGMLGLRLVKRTVNFDDPHTYHFYFGDETGSPGSLLTFFPWPGARRGRVGAGQVAVTSFATPTGSIGFWLERLVRHSIAFEGPTLRRIPGSEPESVISFKDHDGLMLEIVGAPGASSSPGWAGASGVPVDHALRGIHSVTLWVDEHEASERLLVETLGMRFSGEHESTRRFVPTAEPGSATTGRVDLRAVAGFPRGAEGAGTVHHVAFRAADDAAQLELREAVIAVGRKPTPVIDRQYFHSIYFREPAGVLFEIATDSPGFAVDEPAEQLGESLRLPPQYEVERASIEAHLPPLRMPGAGPATPDEPAEPGTGGRPNLSFIHRYRPPAKSGDHGVTLLLLHGTGGDESDLLPLGLQLLPGAGLLSPRGQVLENGMPRFFRRLAEGVFDMEDLAVRTRELAEFVREAADSYRFDPSQVVAVGFSNGANIATSLLLREPGLLKAAVLLSPMLPYEPESRPDLAGTAVFIGAGRSDPVVPTEQVDRLAKWLGERGARVSVAWDPGGHEISPAQVAAAQKWIKTLGR